MYLSKIDSIFSSADTPYCVAIGDFNADHSVTNGTIPHLFGRALVDYCKNEQLVISDSINLAQDNYTYISCTGSTSWLDHIVSTISLHELIVDTKVHYETSVTSDHLPITIVLDVIPSQSHSSTVHNEQGSRSKIKWDLLSGEELECYKQQTEIHLSKVHVPNDLATCNNINCIDPVHISAMNSLYDNVNTAILNSGNCFAKKRRHSMNQIPGWNDCLKELHSQARDAFLLWRSFNSPRHGVLCDSMKRTRASFKLMLRKCRSDKDIHVANSIAKKLLSCDSKSFWSEIKRVNGGNGGTVATTVDGDRR